MVAQVLVGIKTTHIDKTFSYKIPSFMNEQISVGSRVLVPFGKQRLEGFVIDIVDNIDTDYLFITHTIGAGEEDYVLNNIPQEIKAKFKNIIVTEAGCVISTHCGKNTLGLIYLSKEVVTK